MSVVGVPGEMVYREVEPVGYEKAGNTRANSDCSSLFDTSYFGSDELPWGFDRSLSQS